MNYKEILFSMQNTYCGDIKIDKAVLIYNKIPTIQGSRATQGRGLLL